MTKPWLKMWIEWVDDPKMLNLSLAEQGAWWRLVTLAQQCEADGYLVKGNGAPLNLDEITTTLRVTSKVDRKVFDTMISKMEDQGSLHWNSETLIITNFANRQTRVPSETKEAVAERVRRYREKHHVTEKALQEPQDLQEKESSKEREFTEKDKDRDRECNGKKPVTCNGKTITAEAILAEISQLYEKNFGIISPILSEKFKDFAKNYRGPIEWLHDAFAEAVSNNVRKWAYVEAILNTWQVEGRKSHGERKQPRQGRAKPITYIKGSGEDPGRED